MPRQDIYKSKAWKEIRVSYAKSQCCICERCGRPVFVSGVSDENIPKERRLRYVVHHKEYLNDINYTNDEIAYDTSNLELLCIDCHNKLEHNMPRATRKGLEFDELGNLVEKKVIKRVWNG